MHYGVRRGGICQDAPPKETCHHQNQRNTRNKSTRYYKLEPSKSNCRHHYNLRKSHEWAGPGSCLSYRLRKMSLCKPNFSTQLHFTNCTKQWRCWQAAYSMVSTCKIQNFQSFSKIDFVFFKKKSSIPIYSINCTKTLVTSKIKPKIHQKANSFYQFY